MKIICYQIVIPMELFAELKTAFELYFLIISSFIVLLCFRTTHPMVAVERRGRVVVCFVFGRSRVQISTQRPAILTEGFRGFPQFLHANAGIVR
jgi:hypothetical protein